MGFNSAPGSGMGNGPAKTQEGNLERARKSAQARIEIAKKQTDMFNKKPLEGYYVNHNPSEAQRDGWFGQTIATSHGEGTKTTLDPMLESGQVEFIPFGDPKLEEILTQHFLKKIEVGE